MPHPPRSAAARRLPRRVRPVLPALVLAALAAAPAAAQQRAAPVTLSGTVVDAQSGHGIATVLVEVSPGERRAVTDAEGRFSLRLRPGDYVVRVSQMGYGAQERATTLRAGGTEPLVLALQPQPVVLERLEVVLDRFAARRNRVAMSSRVLDRARLARSGGESLAQVLGGAAVPLVQCNAGGAWTLWLAAVTGNNCVYSRGQVVAPAVYVDDMPAFGGMDELATYSPVEAHHVEIYGMGRMIRVYTMAYVEDVAAARRPLHAVADWRCDGC